MTRELRLRILSGIVMAVVTLGATWAGGVVFQLLSIAIALLVYSEWSTMTGLAARDFRGNALGWLAVVSVSVVILGGWAGVALPLLGAFVVLAALWTLINKTRWWLVGGIAYSGMTAISLSAIRGFDDFGFLAMIFVFAVVWATDIMAYFVGRAIGGPKLAPRISPGKTWSGAVGGTFFGVLAGMAVFLSHFSQMDPRIPILAIVLSVSGQIGDLFESYIKRRFDAKDSGRIIPGHGGVMDRVDGLVFACFASLLVVIAQFVVLGGQGEQVGKALLGL